MKKAAFPCPLKATVPCGKVMAVAGCGYEDSNDAAQLASDLPDLFAEELAAVAAQLRTGAKDH